MKTVEFDCLDCGGDGKETCDNPDHGFIGMMPGDIGRIGCPCCGHDPNHKVPNGGKCESCNGTGTVKYVLLTEAEAIKSELDAVMHFVDKWLSGDQLKQSPANRANDAREVALKAIEKAEAEIAALRELQISLESDCEFANCKMSEYAEQNNSLQERQRGLVEAVKKSYLKHWLDDHSIGYAELGTVLMDALCNTLGDDGFSKWIGDYHKELAAKEG